MLGRNRLMLFSPCTVEPPKPSEVIAAALASGELTTEDVTDSLAEIAAAADSAPLPPVPPVPPTTEDEEKAAISGSASGIVSSSGSVDAAGSAKLLPKDPFNERTTGEKDHTAPSNALPEPDTTSGEDAANDGAADGAAGGDGEGSGSSSDEDESESESGADGAAANGKEGEPDEEVCKVFCSWKESYSIKCYFNL